MTSDDLTVRILMEIRDAVHTTNERVDQTNARLDENRGDLGRRIEQLNTDLNKRIDATNERLTEMEFRTATGLSEVTGTLRDVTALLRDRLDLRDRVDRCERDIAELKTRVG